MTIRESLLNDPRSISQRQREIAIEEGRGCLRCGGTLGIEMESSRTQYHFEGDWDSEDNPNKDIPLCRPCAKEHHADWDSMWSDYYGGLL